jgi:hypothetical protein
MREAHSPGPIGQEPPWGMAPPTGIMRKPGKPEDTRRQTLCVPHAHRSWDRGYARSCIPTSENAVKAKFAEILFHALG